MNQSCTKLALFLLLAFVAGLEVVQSAVKEVVDTDTPQTLTNKTVVGVLPVGSILPYGGTSAPTGFLLCDGTAVSRTTYSSLFSILGTSYGNGDGSTTFNLPDLRGRSPLGAGQGAGLSNRQIGALGGEEAHTLTIAEMPSHSHNIRAWPGVAAGSDRIFMYSNEPYDEQRSTRPTGGGEAHSIMHPFAVTNFLIKT